MTAPTLSPEDSAAPDFSADTAAEDQPTEACIAPPDTPLLVAPEIQWTLATRTILHWVACVCYFAVVLFFTQLMYDPEQSLVACLKAYAFDALHWLPAILLLLPLVVYDTLKVSQRVVAPVLKVRDGLQAMAAGNETVTLETPEEAYFQDLVEIYNEVHQRVGHVDGPQISDEQADAALDALLN